AASEGLEAGSLHSIAVSPAFAADYTLYAGSDGGPLYCSSDAGRSWQPLAAGPHHVNCLWIDPRNPALLVAGTSEGAILRSQDGGARWICALAGADAVLALAAAGKALYAGLYRGGLLVSLDQGCGWKRDKYCS